jgi:UDP-3-O-acyl N-acetylglucosamine deacetylase
VRVETVEHLLAAMFVLGIDNCFIEIDAIELPALDGSGLPYYNLLVDSGVRELELPRKEIEVRAPLEVSSGGAAIRAFPADAPEDPVREAAPLSVSYRLDYPDVGVKQEVSFNVTPEGFAREIAPARTFCLEEEIEQLRAAGFGKGADENNTVVLGPAGAKGKLRFTDEPARHKVLDLLGDLFFVGARLVGRVECDRSGHALNREMVKALLRQLPGVSR